MNAIAAVICITAASWGLARTAHAQGNSNVGPAMQQQNPCLAEVAKFEQAIGLVRQTSGNAAAASLKEKLLPAKLENEILMKDGYCGLAKHLRSKKLL